MAPRPWKEPGCREFNIHVRANDPNHVFIYEVYDNAAALEAHRQTPHFKKWRAATDRQHGKARDVHLLTSVALNANADIERALGLIGHLNSRRRATAKAGKSSNHERANGTWTAPHRSLRGYWSRAAAKKRWSRDGGRSNDE